MRSLCPGSLPYVICGSGPSGSLLSKCHPTADHTTIIALLFCVSLAIWSSYCSVKMQTYGKIIGIYLAVSTLIGRSWHARGLGEERGYQAEGRPQINFTFFADVSHVPLVSSIQ